jgi:hypothetical protein
MALNDPRVRGGAPPNVTVRRFQMENTWDIKTNETRQHMIEWVAFVARSSSGRKLKNLVLSCHGLPGELLLGEGFNSDHLPMFDAWSGLIETIWLPDCLVARIPDATMPGARDGNVFCSGLAKRVKCSVVAPTELQCEYPVNVAVDMMTSFEGLVLTYGPAGNVTSSYRNPSTWTDSKGACVPVPD